MVVGCFFNLLTRMKSVLQMLQEWSTLFFSKWWEKKKDQKFLLSRTFQTSQETRVQTTGVLPLHFLHPAVFSSLCNHWLPELLPISVSSYILHDVLMGIFLFLDAYGQLFSLNGSSVSTSSHSSPFLTDHMVTRNKLCLDDARELDGEQSFFLLLLRLKPAFVVLDCSPLCWLCPSGAASSTQALLPFWPCRHKFPPPPKPGADDPRCFQARQQECVLSSLRFHLLRGRWGASLTGGSCCIDSFMGAVPTSD